MHSGVSLVCAGGGTIDVSACVNNFDVRYLVHMLQHVTVGRGAGEDDVMYMRLPFLMEGQAVSYPIHFSSLPNVTIYPRINRLTLSSGHVPL